MFENPPHEEKEHEYPAEDESPVHDQADRQGRRATLADWMQPGHLSWSFRHLREIIPTARIARGERHSPLARREIDEQLPGVEELLRNGNTDGLLVLHDGAVVYEAYARGMRPDDTHMLWSASKSIAGTLTGLLVERGALAPEDDVVTHVHELAGTSFEGAKIRDLLDMREGTDYDETEWAATWAVQFGWLPGTPPEPDAIAWIASFGNRCEHGGPFEYQSILTDVLGLVLERVGGAPLASLIGSELWAPMGAESEADLTVDRHGFPAPNTGISATLRDFGRFGHLMLDGNTVDGRPVVPLSWIEDTVRGGPDSAAAFAHNKYQEYFPNGFYRNQWWVPAGGGVLVGMGSGGQYLYVDRNAGVVIAHFSTLTTELAKERRVTTLAAFRTIADHLSAGAPKH